MKILILSLLTLVVISLGFALRAMTTTTTNTTVSRRQTANALTVRVILSIGLLVVVLVSWKMGWIEPHNAG